MVTDSWSSTCLTVVARFDAPSLRPPFGKHHLAAGEVCSKVHGNILGHDALTFVGTSPRQVASGPPTLQHLETAPANRMPL
jgi:hypothetical protein